MSPEKVEEAGEAVYPAANRVRAAKTETERGRVVAFKFGGTSLLGAKRMLHAAGLVKEAARNSRIAVVVSAMKGMTDRLLGVEKALGAGKLQKARLEAEAVVQAHLDVLAELDLEEDAALCVERELSLLAQDLRHEVMSGKVERNAPASAALRDRLASFGERFCARLFAGALGKVGVAAVPVSSSDFLVTCETFEDAKPDLEETRGRGREVLSPLLREGVVPVVTGFLGITRDGRVTTLGRNSSDYSGAIIAIVVDAEELVIWTDVDGVYTANPNEDSEAVLLRELTYDRAQALSEAGAKVLHANVLPLAEDHKIVVWVRNTFKPEFHGTRIGPVQNQWRQLESLGSGQRGAA